MGLSNDFKVFCNGIQLDNLDDMESTAGEKTVYMFSTDNSVDIMLFEGMDEVIVKPIPSKLYEIYREIVEDIKKKECLNTGLFFVFSTSSAVK